MYNHDDRIVLTLDAGGTNFVFSAIRANEEIVMPVRIDAATDTVEHCLNVITEGFKIVLGQLDIAPVAISFAFPGPADYKNGVIGDLPNFPCFRGGVPMGPYLEEVFGLPVFINNDGALFAYGEALSGELPRINSLLEESGSSKRYHNLIGITLGTGFGGGVVIDGTLLTGDNGSGGSVWCMRNLMHPQMISEESIGKRGVMRSYHIYAPNDERDLGPQDIFNICEGKMEGDSRAALKAFEDLGVVVAEAVAHAIDIVDGLVSIGGGISNAHKYFMNALVHHLNSKLGSFGGDSFGLIPSTAFDLTDALSLKSFLVDDSALVRIPGVIRTVRYEHISKIGVTISKLGASRAVSLGAYAYALSKLDK